ncbi:unnamed protein product [Mytilus coruscus]|uniref:Uncharacterized protein n=1 Tax=Mytilus coruscus TaxID=42192 RepID=A0A6J8CHT8_MYTCO|nr:unnamed protein product [Mytilus coruscus]
MWKIDAGVVKIGGKQVVDENGKKYLKVKSVKECKFVYLPKPSRQLTKEKQNRLPAVTHIEPSFGKSVEDDNFGEFTVDSKTLSSPPQEYLCRTVREDWVVEIRNKIREQAAIPQGTHLPVLVDPSQLFRALQGLSEETTFSYLSLASEEGLDKTAGNVYRLKKQEKACRHFMSSSWKR